MLALRYFVTREYLRESIPDDIFKYMPASRFVRFVTKKKTLFESPHVKARGSAIHGLREAPPLLFLLVCFFVHHHSGVFFPFDPPSFTLAPT